MTCQELSEIYDSYALGCTDGPERDELREHLSRNCPTCVPGVRAGFALTSRLGAVTKQVDPPVRLRKRILALANPSLFDEAPPVKRGFGWSLLLAAIAILFMVSTGYLAVQIAGVSKRGQLANERLAAALAVLSAPDSVEVTFGNTQPRPPRGKVFINPQKGVLLMASNLPVLRAGKKFEMWVIPKKGNPIPSGLFTADAGGAALAMQTGPIDTASVGAIAVTVEDEAGVQAPTTTPIIVAAMATP